ncbi:MAG: ADP-forming succinate--CoA ligase subunit beta [Chloroflexi bacterium]|nr:ADP-forming succinate--CoA ligase subunit beta [Chloroflexota bacterium]
MKLYEFQAKDLFAQADIPIPRGRMVTDPDGAASAARELGRCVVKAQAHAGGRGKAGFIKLAETPERAREHAAAMLGQTFKGFVIGRLLVEEAVDIANEYYLAITIDRATKSPIVICSAQGGVDIEEVAATRPEAIVNLVVDVAYGPWDYQLRDLATRAGLDPKAQRQFVDIAKKLYRVFVQTDASLAEINPLMVLKDGRMIAADAKFDIDDNALFRHQNLLGLKEEAEEDPIEAEAHREGVTYVRLPGDIGIMGNGAGIVMGTLDMVTRQGGHPANFCDIGGGASAETVRKCLRIVLLNPNVKGVLINVFGGITRGDEVAHGVIEATGTMDVKVPIVVRMAGTRADEGLKILEGSALTPVADPVEAARTIIRLAEGA